MSILQFNVSHSKTEDRLLLRLTTREDQEYRLWLTRLLTRELLGHLHLALEAPAPATPTTPAEANPGQPARAGTTAPAHSPFAQEFRPARHLPLGSEPILVVGHHIEAHRNRFNLHLQLRTGQVLDLSLTPALLRQIQLLLQTMQHQAQWTGDAPPATRLEAPHSPYPDLDALPVHSTVLH